MREHPKEISVNICLLLTTTQLTASKYTGETLNIETSSAPKAVSARDLRASRCAAEPSSCVGGKRWEARSACRLLYFARAMLPTSLRPCREVHAIRVSSFLVSFEDALWCNVFPRRHLLFQDYKQSFRPPLRRWDFPSAAVCGLHPLDPHTCVQWP